MNNSEITPKNAEELQQLAMHLSINHLRWDIPPADWDRVLQRPVPNLSHRRTIAVVGAGASVAAGLPLTGQAIKRLLERLQINPDTLRVETERLELIHGFAPGEFETALLAFSNIIYPPEKVRDSLHEMYSSRYQPLLVYEVLAHMLKHRFLDAIINFNFDELLDQAVADELAPHEYHYIVHDGDCPKGADNPAKPYELPIYIKPHGTASHRSSLRFTREAYYGIPREIQRVMHDLLLGMPVTLLVIGFRMQSLEFNRLLERSTTAPLDIFYLNPKKPDPDLELEHDLNDYLIQVGESATLTLDDRMRQIWQAVSDTFRAHYRPRGIERHDLVCQIFANAGPSSVPQGLRGVNTTQYLHDRTLVELALAMAKAKGLINMSVISQDRFGQYYDLYYARAKPNHELLYNMCTGLGLKDTGYSREALRLVGPKADSSHGILDRDPFRQSIHDLSNKFAGLLYPQHQNAMINCNQAFEDTLMYLYDSQEIELRGQVDQLHNKVFNHPKPVRTLSGLSYETVRLLEAPRWDTLFVIAETGEWLLAEEIVTILSEREAKIYLVVADLSFVEKLRDTFGHQSLAARSMHWWDHNRHLTLTVYNRIPISAIYFARRLRSPSISPVVLTGQDVHFALDTFIAYWYKTEGEDIDPDDLRPGPFFDSL